MQSLSFLTDTVAVPFWLFILLIAGLVPLFYQLFTLVNHFRRGEIVRETDDDMVLWKIRNVKRSASPKKSSTDISKEQEQEKQNEKESNINQVLKVVASGGDRGILLKSIVDRVSISSANVNRAVKELVDRKIIEEVAGVSGTKYYLTQVGKMYCAKKGLANPNNQ
jgi:YesN/AraC family two-component response regulator